MQQAMEALQARVEAMAGALKPLAVALASVCLLLTACEEEPPEVVAQIRAIKTVTVADRSSGQMRRFPGVVEAVDTSSLSFEVAGNTREVNVNVGDRVAMDQALATLDDTPFKLNVEAARAEVGRAKADLAESQTEFDRKETLYKKEWVAKAAFDQALAARDSSASQVSYTVSKLNLARRDLEKTVLRAPFEGVIASKFVDPFQEVARGEKVFEIYAEGAMQVVLTVPETSIGDIFLGLPAEVSFSAESAESLNGRISEVGSVASEANAFPVKVALLEPPEGVLPGMTAEVSLILGSADESVSYLIPISAIAAGTDIGRGYVFVFDPESSTVKKTEIRGGGVRDNRVVVTEGIEGGDVIAVAGVSFLRDGQTVKLMSR